jgi:hypothetical protein
MREEGIHQIIAKGFLQMNVPSSNSGSDGRSDKVIVQYLAKAIFDRGKQCEWDVKFDVYNDALLPPLFELVDTNIDVSSVVTERKLSAI